MSVLTSWPLSPYAAHRAQEVALVTHRGQSTAAMQTTTSAMPWGIALDVMHGYVWVAEPGREPTPKCPMVSQGIPGQYAFSDGSCPYGVFLKEYTGL